MKKKLLLLACMAFFSILPTWSADNDELWITVGSDAVPAMRQTLKTHGWNGHVHAFRTDRGVSVTKISQKHLADLATMMHAQFKRCGGYMVHKSYQDAVRALNNPDAVTAVKQTLVAYSIDQSQTVNAVMGQLSSSNVLNTVTQLSNFTNRYYTTSHGAQASTWLRDLWQGYAQGRSDVTVELYNHSGYGQASVIATIQGTDLASEVVVVGGHLDSTAGFGTGESTRAPGADDDASGIATLTEVFRACLAADYKPARTIKFMGFAAEEVGLRGSGDIAGSFKSAGVNVVGMVQLDMTNYNGSSDDIVMMQDYTNAAQNAFIGNLIDTYLPDVSWAYDSCGYGCSDHASWTSEGYPASMPFESRMSEYNTSIHSANDTLAQSGNNVNHAMKFARMASAFVVEMAKVDGGTTPDPDPDPDPDPTPGPQTESFSGNVSRNQETQFGPFDVEPGTDFTADMSGSGDADLYVRWSAPPTRSSYDCRPYKNGSAETCGMTVPGGVSEAFVMVRGYASSSNYNLDVTYTAPGGTTPDPDPNPDPDPTPDPVTETITITGSVAYGAENPYGPYDVVPGTTVTAVMSPTNGDGGDADLYTRFGQAPTRSSYECRPYANGSNETCSDTVPSGVTQFYFMVHGYSAANYTIQLTYTHP